MRPKPPSPQATQGNCILSGQDLEQVIFAPAGEEPLSFDANLGRLFLAQKIERQMAQDGEILRGVTAADAAGVFVKADIQTPVQLVLDPPVTAYRVPALTAEIRELRMNSAAEKSIMAHNTASSGMMMSAASMGSFIACHSAGMKLKRASPAAAMEMVMVRT